MLVDKTKTYLADTIETVTKRLHDRNMTKVNSFGMWYFLPMP